MYLQKDIKLFRGAVSRILNAGSSDWANTQIMESGAPSTAPIGPSSSSWQVAYDGLVGLLNCTSANATSYKASNQSSFECLKAAPAEAILAAQLQVQTRSFGA
jgi:hypothetical protein